MILIELEKSWSWFPHISNHKSRPFSFFCLSGAPCFFHICNKSHCICMSQGRHGEFEPGKAQYSTPIFFHQLFLIRAYDNPKSGQSWGLPALAPPKFVCDYLCLLIYRALNKKIFQRVDNFLTKPFQIAVLTLTNNKRLMNHVTKREFWASTTDSATRLGGLKKVNFWYACVKLSFWLNYLLCFA